MGFVRKEKFSRSGPNDSGPGRKRCIRAVGLVSEVDSGPLINFEKTITIAGTGSDRS